MILKKLTFSRLKHCIGILIKTKKCSREVLEKLKFLQRVLSLFFFFLNIVNLLAFLASEYIINMIIRSLHSDVEITNLSYTSPMALIFVNFSEIVHKNKSLTFYLTNYKLNCLSLSLTFRSEVFNRENTFLWIQDFSLLWKLCGMINTSIF